jgi:hypothetical protein
LLFPRSHTHTTLSPTLTYRPPTHPLGPHRVSLVPNIPICRKVSVPPSLIQTIKLLPTMRLGSAPTADPIGDLSGMQVPRSPSQYLLTNAFAGLPRFAGKYFAWGNVIGCRGLYG